MKRIFIYIIICFVMISACSRNSDNNKKTSENIINENTNYIDYISNNKIFIANSNTSIDTQNDNIDLSDVENEIITFGDELVLPSNWKEIAFEERIKYATNNFNINTLVELDQFIEWGQYYDPKVTAALCRYLLDDNKFVSKCSRAPYDKIFYYYLKCMGAIGKYKEVMDYCEYIIENPPTNKPFNSYRYGPMAAIARIMGNEELGLFYSRKLYEEDSIGIGLSRHIINLAHANKAEEIVDIITNEKNKGSISYEKDYRKYDKYLDMARTALEDGTPIKPLNGRPEYWREYYRDKWPLN